MVRLGDLDAVPDHGRVFLTYLYRDLQTAFARTYLSEDELISGIHRPYEPYGDFLIQSHQ